MAQPVIPDFGEASDCVTDNRLFCPDWVKENWDVLVKKMPPSFTILGSVVAMASSGFTKPEQLKDVETFFEGKSTKGFERNLAQSYDAVRAKIGWLERDSKDVEEWLKENKYL